MRTVLAGILAAFLALAAGPAAAEEDLTATAKAAIDAFVGAVMAGPEALAPVLAPEFQSMRANGTGYSRDDYLASGASEVKIYPGFSAEDIVATRDGDILVARYMLRIEETIDGKPVSKRAPRISVFRRIDGVWKIVSHANFAATE
jgi:ketosteroid isomerase-like protein